MAPKNPPIPPDEPKRVEIVAFPAVQLLDVAGPSQVFTAANEQFAERGLLVPYDVHVVAPSPEVMTTAGLTFATEPLPTRTRIDTLLVAGGQGVMRAAADPDLASWVRQRSTEARRTASVCTGAFMLGAAGLLDGRRAVTHLRFCGELARRYPLVAVEPDPIFIWDGQIWTSAGVTAGIDLALALVEEDLGRPVALAVARQLVVFLKRPGANPVFSSCLLLETQLPMKRIATRCGLGAEETMRRAFLRSQGVGPKEYRDRFS